MESFYWEENSLGSVTSGPHHLVEFLVIIRENFSNFCVGDCVGGIQVMTLKLRGLMCHPLYIRYVLYVQPQICSENRFFKTTRYRDLNYTEVPYREILLLVS